MGKSWKDDKDKDKKKRTQRSGAQKKQARRARKLAKALKHAMRKESDTTTESSSETLDPRTPAEHRRHVRRACAASLKALDEICEPLRRAAKPPASTGGEDDTQQHWQWQHEAWQQESSSYGKKKWDQGRSKNPASSSWERPDQGQKNPSSSSWDRPDHGQSKPSSSSCEAADAWSGWSGGGWHDESAWTNQTGDTTTAATADADGGATATTADADGGATATTADAVGGDTSMVASDEVLANPHNEFDLRFCHTCKYYSYAPKGCIRKSCPSKNRRKGKGYGKGKWKNKGKQGDHGPADATSSEFPPVPPPVIIDVEGDYEPTLASPFVKQLPVPAPLMPRGRMLAHSCLVCLNECLEAPTFLPCAHGPFHPDCLENFLRYYRNCPVCRFTFSDALQELLPVPNSVAEINIVPSGDSAAVGAASVPSPVNVDAMPVTPVAATANAAAVPDEPVTTPVNIVAANEQPLTPLATPAASGADEPQGDAGGAPNESVAASSSSSSAATAVSTGNPGKGEAKTNRRMRGKQSPADEDKTTPPE